jgi:hypothetical protein
VISRKLTLRKLHEIYLNVVSDYEQEWFGCKGMDQEQRFARVCELYAKDVYGYPPISAIAGIAALSAERSQGVWLRQCNKVLSWLGMPTVDEKMSGENIHALLEAAVPVMPKEVAGEPQLTTAYCVVPEGGQVEIVLLSPSEVEAMVSWMLVKHPSLPVLHMDNASVIALYEQLKEDGQKMVQVQVRYDP